MRYALNTRFLYRLNIQLLQLSIIIVNYNVKYFLEQCLCSVIKACAGIDAEIFVVDNNSSDGSEAYLQPKFPVVKFRWDKINNGFGKANNIALREAKGEYILFLNPDTIVPEDCFTKCLGFFKQHQDCGALGVRMIDGSGSFLKESKRSFPSAMASFYKMAGLAALFPKSKVFAAYYAGHLPEKKNNAVDVLAGAFMMLTKNMAAATKGFDESFFMYAEDIDLSYRIQKEGKKNYYFPETTIIHFKGESTQKLSKFYIRHFYGAMQRFVSKHYSEKKATLFFTSIAIFLTKVFAHFKLFLNKMFASRAGLPFQQQMAVITSQKDFNEVIHLLKYASFPINICGRITADEAEIDDNLGPLSKAELIIKEKKITQLLFCETAIANKNVIEVMEGLSGKVNFLFHQQGSCSIVGSNEKNRNGIFIAKA